MTATISSLSSLSAEVSHEIIFIDDHSTDNTYAQLTSIVNNHSNWHIYELPENSGSAAAPRNLGIKKAQGEYLFFLDSDDVILPTGILKLCQFAETHKHQVIRSTILLEHGNGHKVLVDKIPRWSSLGDLTSKIRAIVRHQSLTCSFFVSRQLLDEQQIRFPLDRRIGEDISFTAMVLAAAKTVGYQDVAARTYVRNGDSDESITQSISSRHFADFVRSWNNVEDILSSLNVSFVKEHGHAALQYALRQFLWFKNEDMERDTFKVFRSYLSRHWSLIQDMTFPDRYKNLIEAVHSGDYNSFNRQLRLRLVIAGHDLKFLKNLIPGLETEYDLKIDSWLGHNVHDVRMSTELLAWADVVWAEWLLGAAVWYSKNLRSDQRLVVRAHRSEMTVDYGLDLKLTNCSKIIAIAPHCLGDFSDRFDIPRDRFRLIPNGFDIDSYDVGTDPNRLFIIAMVGSLPKLKGFHRAIELLSELRDIDPRFKLRIYGKRATELSWLNDIEEERKYYSDCESRISELGLSDHIEYAGWVATEKELAKVGFVLSLSDFEGMQVGPGEAFCAGGQGLFLNWRGVEYVYPSEYIFSDISDMRHYIAENVDPVIHAHNAQAGLEFVAKNYNQTRINMETLDLLRSIRA